MSNKMLWKRLIFIMITVTIAFVVQTTLLKMIPYYNISANLLLICVCSFGLLYGRSYGLWIGFAAGLLSDLFYGGGIVGIYSLVYMYIGFLNGLLSDVLLKDVVSVPILFILGSEIFYHAYVYIFTYSLRNRLNLFQYVKTVMIPELLLTLVGMIIIYGILLSVSNLLEEAKEKGEGRLA